MGKPLLVFVVLLGLLTPALIVPLLALGSKDDRGFPQEHFAGLRAKADAKGRSAAVDWIDRLRAACMTKDRAAWNELRFESLVWTSIAPMMSARPDIDRAALHFALGQAALVFGDPVLAQAEFLAGLRFEVHESELREGLRTARAELGLSPIPEIPAPFALPGRTELWVLLAFVSQSSGLLFLLFARRRRRFAVLILAVGLVASGVVITRHVGGPETLAVVHRPQLEVRSEPGSDQVRFSLRAGELVRVRKAGDGSVHVRHRLGSGYVAADDTALQLVGTR